MEENRTFSKFRKYFSRDVKIKILFISLILLVLIGVLLNFTVYYDKIYYGISINGVYVGGSTLEEAEEILEEYYSKLDKVNIDVKCGKKQTTILGKEINASFDVAKSLEVAFNYGREGNIFKRVINGLKYQFGDVDITYNINYDRLSLDSKIDKFISSIGREVVQPEYSVVEDKLYIKTGVTGISVDEALITSQIINGFNHGKTETVICDLKQINPEPINISKIRNEIKKEVKDATYINEAGAFEVIDEVVGVDFDVENAEKIVNAVTAQGVQFTIDLIITQPQVTKEKLLEEIFSEELASFTTYYKVSEKQRSENVRLSAEFINDIILMPGQEFSYNNAVGERSIERGFQVAKVYQAGKVVDGLGGGICQTSSTLYDAVLLADLEVTERKNHSLPVSYVKLGRDATVSYGTTDFRFKNNQMTPIKIDAVANGGTLTIKILGFTKDSTKEVIIKTETIKVRPFTETIVEDTTMPVGSSKVVTKGSNGYTVKAYKIVKQNGVEIENKLISTDTYAPIVQVKKVGAVANIVNN